MTTTVKEYQKRQCDEVEGALKVIAPWLSNNSNLQIKPCQGTPHADIDKGIIYVPPMNGMSQSNLWLARAFFYHESAHILETKMKKSEQSKLNKALFTIVNSLEDYRIEKHLSTEHKGAEAVFRWSRDYFSSRIAEQITEEKVEAPLWEALVYMQLTLAGGVPKWYLTEAAKAYYDVGWETYQKIRDAKNTNDSLNIANELYELFKQAKRDMQQDAGEQNQEGESQDGEDESENQNQKNQKNQKKKNQKKQEKKNSGPAKDMPNEDGSDSDGSDSDGSDSEGSESQEGSSENSEDGSDESDSEGSSKNSSEGDESEEESSEGSDGSEDSDEDGEGSSEGDENDSEGEDESSSEGSDGSEDGSSNGNNNDKSSNSSSSEKDENALDGKHPNENKEGEIDTSNGNSDGSGEVIEKDIKKQLEEIISKELDEESEGSEVSEMLQKDLDEVVKELNNSSSQNYRSMRENDEFIQLNVTKEHREAYTKIRREVSGAVSGMSRALEQALRSMAQSNKRPMMPRGRLDKRRLATMAKSLSKHVFYETDPGQKLNTSVILLVDESGSMCRVTSEVNRVVAAICESMNNIGVPFEVYGTTTKYGAGSIPYSLNINGYDGYDRTNPLQVRVYKTFGENWVNVRPRVSQLSCYQHNADGEIIELAATRLQSRKEERKIILSVCDGIPDAGHGNDCVMGEYLTDICRKVRSQKVEVYGFGINTSEPERYYGKKNFIKLDGLKGLNNTFFREFSRIITDGKVKM